MIERALELIGACDGWCVEFGAWDGKFASNTHALIEHKGYSGVLMEADAARFESLRRTYAGRADVITLQRLVAFEGSDRLDRILAGTPVPHDFDVLSIDIDGNDYHVWEALRDYRPKLVIIEFNPTIPNEVHFVQPRDMAVMQGSSLTAITALAKAKGYRLIHATVVNGIFVDERYFGGFGIVDDDPAALRADLSLVTWLFQTYDGAIHLAGSDRLRWHNVPLRADRLQVLPRSLRTFPADFSRKQRLAWFAWRLVREPRALVRHGRLLRWIRRLGQGTG